MTSITHLSDYKKVKKIEKIVDDLIKIEKVISASIKIVGPYKKYTPAKNVLANLMENKALVVVHLKQCKEMLGRYYASHQVAQISEKNPG